MKKGFTLIELLAVIVILAVIALIATPAVLNIIEDSKKSSAEASARNIVRAAENYYLERVMEKEYIDTIDLSGSDLKYDGDKATKGILNFSEDGKVSGKMYISGYCIEVTTGDVVANKVLESECVIDSTELSKDVVDLTNTTWVLDDTGYKFSTVPVASEDFVSQANKLIDLPDANLTFTSNGKKYIGITSLYLPFDAPLSSDIQISAFGITAGFTSGAFDKIDFPFGSTITANKGIILYAIDTANGFYVPYYEANGWYNNNYKTVSITGGDDVKNTVVIKWFKTHGRRIK